MKQINVKGWVQNGEPIEAPEGYHASDYFRDGKYLGADADGIEPVIDIHLIDFTNPFESNDEFAYGLSIYAHHVTQYHLCPAGDPNFDRLTQWIQEFTDHISTQMRRYYQFS